MCCQSPGIITQKDAIYQLSRIKPRFPHPWTLNTTPMIEPHLTASHSHYRGVRQAPAKALDRCLVLAATRWTRSQLSNAPPASNKRPHAASQPPKRICTPWNIEQDKWVLPCSMCFVCVLHTRGRIRVAIVSGGSCNLRGEPRIGGAWKDLHPRQGTLGRSGTKDSMRLMYVFGPWALWLGLNQVQQ